MERRRRVRRSPAPAGPRCAATPADASLALGERWTHLRVVGIRRWKHRLPEAGALFRGGVTKRSLPGSSDDGLWAFVAETRRAELVHWAIPAIVPLFALWNPPWLFAAMVGYAPMANVPCLLVQRYNRARLLRLLERRSAVREAS